MPDSPLAVVAGPELADYHFGSDHPFGPLRQQNFLDGMKRSGLSDRVDFLTPSRCDKARLASFHDPSYIDWIKSCSDSGDGYLDQGDTPARAGIYSAACTVVGSVVDLIDRIMRNEYRRGFVPIAGLHHAYRDRCSGFCVFNDIAIAIEHVRKLYHRQRILYVDIDAHHGDGVFYNYQIDQEVYIVDFHEDGRYLFPGTGTADETGSGPAQGTKMNIPMPMQAGDAEFEQQWRIAEVFIRTIEPDFIILQCGADSMRGDPITHLAYSEQSYALAASSLAALADEFCQGKMIALGGGGYNQNNIAQAWPRVVRAMLESS